MPFPWHKFADVVSGLAPLLGLIPGFPPVLAPLLLYEITRAEIELTDGTSKKQYVLNRVKDGMVTLNATKGEIILDPDEVIPAASAAIDAVITTVKAVKVAHDKLTTPLTAPPPSKPAA